MNLLYKVFATIALTLLSPILYISLFILLLGTSIFIHSKDTLKNKVAMVFLGPVVMIAIGYVDMWDINIKKLKFLRRA